MFHKVKHIDTKDIAVYIQKKLEKQDKNINLESILEILDLETEYLIEKGVAR